MMMKIGLTGNIGSGKSTVSGIFALLGIPVFKADEVSKRFLADPGVMGRIRDCFGENVFSASGDINRAKLGAIVCPDRQKLATLNGILHPLVIQAFRDWMDQQTTSYIIHEAAILFESGYRDQFDKVIHVSCPPEQCIQRVIERDKVAKEAILERMQYQWSDEEKVALSDYVIRNDGSQLVIPQVLAIHKILKS
jgi:dephospho-CoA kinase